MTNLYKIFGFLFFLACEPSAFAASLEKGMTAIKNRNFSAAFAHLEPLAKDGDAVAQYNLGVMHIRGLGTKKNGKVAIKWLTLAANQENFLAQYFLGYIYEHGKSVQKNYKAASVFYKQAAKQGHPSAQTNLGALYYFGHGVKQNNILAHFWWTIASSKVEGADRNKKMIEGKMTADELSQSEMLVRLCNVEQLSQCLN